MFTLNKMLLHPSQASNLHLLLFIYNMFYIYISVYFMYNIHVANIRQTTVHHGGTLSHVLYIAFSP